MGLDSIQRDEKIVTMLHEHSPTRKESHPVVALRQQHCVFGIFRRACSSSPTSVYFGYTGAWTTPNRRLVPNG